MGSPSRVPHFLIILFSFTLYKRNVSVLLKAQCAPHNKHFTCKIYKTNLTVFYKAKFAVCSEIHLVEIFVSLNLVVHVM